MIGISGCRTDGTLVETNDSTKSPECSAFEKFREVKQSERDAAIGLQYISGFTSVSEFEEAKQDLPAAFVRENEVLLQALFSSGIRFNPESATWELLVDTKWLEFETAKRETGKLSLRNLLGDAFPLWEMVVSEERILGISQSDQWHTWLISDFNSVVEELTFLAIDCHNSLTPDANTTFDVEEEVGMYLRPFARN
jgi:hypothetical protein